MKIILNGFEIDLTNDETTMTLKVTDANGKELSNNTFTQSETIDTVQPVEMPSAQDASGAQEQTAEESLIPTLESLKKSLNKKKV